MRRLSSIFIALLFCLIPAGSALSANTGGVQETEGPDTKEQAFTMMEDQSQEGSSVEKGLLRIGLTDPVSTLDVQRTSSDYMIPLNIYERLFDIRVREDGSSTLVNGLAEEYSVSENGLTYHFTIRDDAYFSDGTPVKASDVAFTFTRMLALPESAQTDFADMILGAGDVINGSSDKPVGIKVLDDRHLEIMLTQPFSGYLYMLATPSCSILSEDFVTKAGDEFGSSAKLSLGSGPYRVTEFTNERITLELNQYYHCHEGEQLSAQKAEVLILPPALMDRTFQAGGLDILDANTINPDIVENVYKSPEWSSRLISRNRVEVQYLMMNLETPPLNDIRIRHAIQMAIDRQGILNELYGGNGVLLDGIFPRGLIGFTPENQGWLRYDPDEARRLVREVGSAGEIRLELAANSASSFRKLTMLERIRQNLSDVGLNVSIVNYDEESLLYLRKSGKLMSYAGEWSADFNDPDNFIYTFFGSRSKTHSRSCNYANANVIRRIGEARAIQNEKERLAEYSDLEMILVRDEAVWVPLFSSDHLFVLGERVESFTPFWAGWSSMYIKDVILKEGA